MGKGDKKTKRGKIFMGSYGITRRRKKEKSLVIIGKKKAVTAKSTVPEKAVEVKSASGGKGGSASGGKDVLVEFILKDEGLNITKKHALNAHPEHSRRGAEGAPSEKTKAKTATKKTASKKISVSTSLNMTKKTTVKKAATKKTSAKK